MVHGKSFGEITQSSLNMAHCALWEWDQFPHYGSLVAIDSAVHTTYGIITEITTGPIDGTRAPYPYKKTEEELRRDHPHIFEFIRSTCTLFLLGYAQNTQNGPKNSHIEFITPPTPPKIHAFVRPLLLPEISSFFTSPAYIDRIFASNELAPIADDLLVTLLRQHNPPIDPLAERLMLIIGGDYCRTKRILSHLDLS